MSTVVSGKRKKIVMSELVEGHQSASRLRFLLHNPLGVEASLSSSAHELVAKILRSFTHSLSVLTSNGSPAAEPSCLDRRSRDSSQSSKRLLPAAPVTKNRRGCYKRRKTAETWTVVSNTTDDNHAWRKYGRKKTLNFKFPRSYYRCSRKYEKGCKAVKQVQLIQENPEMYEITYIGYHTCKDTPKTPQVVAESGNYWESSSLASHSADSKLPSEEEQMRPSRSSSSTVKQENPTAETPSGVTDNLDPGLWSDLKDLKLSEAAIMPSKMESNHAGNVYWVDSVQFDSDFYFDESRF